jgi:transposase
MGRSTEKETRLSEQRKYRSWAAQQKLEIVLAGLRGDRSTRGVCGEHGVSETLYYSWREKLFESGKMALAGKAERQGERELRRKIAELERALGRKTYELEIAGKALAQTELPAAGAAAERRRPVLPAGRARRPLRGHARPERHLLLHLRQLPGPDRRQDGARPRR